MNTKFTKILVIVAVAALALGSLTYFTRTVFDIGCANTELVQGNKWKRHFLGMNCWYWEGNIDLQAEL